MIRWQKGQVSRKRKTQGKANNAITIKQMELQVLQLSKTNCKRNVHMMATISTSDSRVLLIPVRLMPIVLRYLNAAKCHELKYFQINLTSVIKGVNGNLCES
jgi:hypothetical protein